MLKNRKSNNSAQVEQPANKLKKYLINKIVILFKDNQAQREYINQKLKTLFPKFKSGGFYFRNYIKKHLQPNAIIVDAGCGQGGVIAEFKSTNLKIIGIDLDKGTLDRNPVVDRKILASLEKIPLADCSVDSVISEFVLEHLEKPGPVLKEIFRILKPGGFFIFLTSNIINPIMSASKLLPYQAHHFFRSKLIKKPEKTHRTYYRINTKRKLIRLGRKSGFYPVEIMRAGNPEYLGFSPVLVPLAISLEKMIDNRLLGIFKTYLTGCFIKTKKLL